MNEHEFKAEKGIIQPDPELVLDPVVLELVNARNALIEAKERMARAQDASRAMLDSESKTTRTWHPYPDELKEDRIADIEERLRAAHRRLLGSYAMWGGFRYHGWTNQRDPENYYGPVIWSEHDCVHQYALELERAFPVCVHTEFKINKASTAGYDPATHPMQSIDIVVPGLDGFEEGEDSQERFRNRSHEVFIEAKWLKKGRWTKAGEHLSRAEGITKDLSNLKRAKDEGRCQIGAVLLFDDECFLDFHQDVIDWPEGIERLIVSPSELKRQGFADPELEAILDDIYSQHSERCRCDELS